MLDKRLAVTGAAVALVAALAVVAALLPEQEAVLQIQEQAPGVATAQSGAERARPRHGPESPETENRETERGYLYLIREYNGYIAVFGADPETPEMVLDKLVKHLPEYDRLQMREGIEIHSLMELSERIEDYIG